MKFIVLLFLSFHCFSQQKPLDFKIENIRVNAEEGARVFELEYSITNLSEKQVNFILLPDQIIPIAAGSLSPKPYYKIYENGKVFEAMGIFTTRSKERIFQSELAFKNFMDSLSKAELAKTEEQIKQEKKELFLSKIQHLKPKQTKTYISKLYWNKKRYYKNDVMEYYIDEKEKYEIELHINLMAEELFSDFDPTLFKENNLIKGWYTSNRVPIDFGE